MYIFSYLIRSRSKSNYDESKVDEWIDRNIDNKRDIGFGWVYLLHTCIKQDNPKYYENISQSYSFMNQLLVIIIIL